MVLALLGTSITSAIQLDVITSALFQADFDIKHIMKLDNKIEKIVNLDQLDAGHDERKINKQAYFNELCKVLDPGEPSFTPNKGEQSIVMFVGLQGSGKTTTCREYAYCHQNRGWKPAMVCVDQLKENVAKPTIPFYGSYKESDPVTIAVEGVKIFKEENHDLIIIDASGGHEEEASLFEEMHQLYEATRPDLVIFVMDSSIEQAAFDQAQALKHHVEVGAVILTEGGGGAQSGVAATKSPVISDMDDDEFEILKDKWPVISHMDEFEIFKVKPFVERLLGLMEKKILGTSSFTFRTLRKKYQGLLRVPARARTMVGSMLGFNGYEGPKVERYMTMIDSMTKEELDSLNPKFLNKSRMIRIARDSGHQVSDVEELLHALKHQAKIELSMRAYSKRLLWSSSTC